MITAAPPVRHPARSAPAVRPTTRTVATSEVRARTFAPLMIVTVVLVSLTCHLRWSLAASTTWHCDEIPLLVRFTGLCGTVTNEAEAAQFVPTMHSFRMGALRSFHVPDYTFAAHTTTNFWTNLGIHIFGMSHTGGRAGSLFWSAIAIIAAGCAVRIAGGGVIGASVAALVVAMSPFATAYAAQARGYAESMALAPLLLIALELLRRDPRSPVRAVAAMVCASQLSLTVYTTWVFWVFPLLVLVALLLPRYADLGDERVQLRLAVALIAAAVFLFMGVFTAERWKTLTFAAQNGERYVGLPAWIEFLSRFGRQLLSGAGGIAALALIGVIALFRSPTRWWSWAIAAGIVMPAFFGWLNGSPGYARNLTYLLVPVAILAGLGAESAARLLSRIVPRRALVMTITLILAGGATWAYADLERRARSILLPDWGEVVQRLDREPATVGPRWLCPCLANHWQIEWYEDAAPVETFWNVPVGGKIEVAMGAALGEDLQPRVYGYDPALKFIAEQPLPRFLASIPPDEVRSGIQLRLWSASRIDTPMAWTEPNAPGAWNVSEGADQSDPPANGASFLLVRYPSVPPTSAWDRFLSERVVQAHGLVAFKERPLAGEVVQSYVVASEALSDILQAMRTHFDIEPDAIHVFRLDAL